MRWLSWSLNKRIPRREFLGTAIKKGGVTVLPLVFAPGVVLLSGGTTASFPGNSSNYPHIFSDGTKPPGKSIPEPLPLPDGVISVQNVPVHGHTVGPVFEPTVPEGGVPIPGQGPVYTEACRTDGCSIASREGAAGPSWRGPHALEECEKTAAHDNLAQQALLKALGVKFGGGPGEPLANPFACVKNFLFK